MSKSDQKEGEIKHIVVDMTPVRPGGENGGAKFLAIELVHQLSHKVAPHCKYTLLTSSDTHEELSHLDSNNVRRKCINQRQIQPDLAMLNTHNRTFIQRWVHLIGLSLEKNLPIDWYRPLYSFYKQRTTYPRNYNLIKKLNPDLLFCPFTAPFYHHPTIPVILVVHDLQYRAYPQFFSTEQINLSDHYFRQSCLAADRLICVSDYTRKAVLETQLIAPDKTTTIHSTLINPLSKIQQQVNKKILNQYHLNLKKYLLYPANFWQHKNHEMLLTAFGMYRQSNPGSNLKLVLTGNPDERSEFIKKSAIRMGLEDWVVLPGFVDTLTFSALLQASLALIFPSLYEGFGFPLLEAMHFSIPILCSNTTSLPEVAQQAAHFFDPRRPHEICNAIERIESDSTYRTNLIEIGKQRIKEFMSVEEWAKAYFEVFQQVTQSERVFPNLVEGVHGDHWIEKTLKISISPGGIPRWLELELEIPPWLSSPHLSVDILLNGKKHGTYQLERGNRDRIRLELPEKSVSLDLSFSPTNQPKQLGFNEDERQLSCRLISCKLATPQQIEFLYQFEME